MAMTLAQLQAAVITETNRPDLIPETLQAVLEATLSIHTVDNFYKDIVEAQVVFNDPTLFLQILDTTTLPLFRNTAYIRKTDPGITAVEQQTSQSTFSSGQFNFLKRVDVGDILDNYGYEKADIYYQAGSQINIKSGTALGYITVGWYAYPNLDPTGVAFASWIAREFPYVIVYKAAAGIFAKIGEDKSWSIYSRAPIPGRGDDTGGLYYQQLAQLRRNNILVEGW